MSRPIKRLLVAGVVTFWVTALSSCYVSSGYSVGYGYTADPYGEYFYSRPVDRYGFYGHP